MTTTPSTELLQQMMLKLKPGDGYSVTLIDEDGSIGLYLNLKVNQQYVGTDGDVEGGNTVALHTWVKPTEFERGEAYRLYLISDAICRFFNTGGEWDTLGTLFSKLKHNGIGTVDFRPYHLIRSFLTIDYDEMMDGTPAPTYSYQHAYASDAIPLEADTPVFVVHESAGPSISTYGELDDGEE